MVHTSGVLAIPWGKDCAVSASSDELMSTTRRFAVAMTVASMVMGKDPYPRIIVWGSIAMIWRRGRGVSSPLPAPVVPFSTVMLVASTEKTMYVPT